MFLKTPELFILLPILLNLKGNLEMNLAARFSTSVKFLVQPWPDDCLLTQIFALPGKSGRLGSCSHAAFAHYRQFGLVASSGTRIWSHCRRRFICPRHRHEKRERHKLLREHVYDIECYGIGLRV